MELRTGSFWVFHSQPGSISLNRESQLRLSYMEWLNLYLEVSVVMVAYFLLWRSRWILNWCGLGDATSAVQIVFKKRRRIVCTRLLQIVESEQSTSWGHGNHQTCCLSITVAKK